MALSQQLVRFLRNARQLPTADVVAMAGWGIVLVTIEIVGRLSTSDVTDFVILATLVGVTLMIHSAQQLLPVRWAGQFLRSFAEQVIQPEIEFGVDLRTNPPIPKDFPHNWSRVLLGLALTAGILLVTTTYFPTRVREVLVHYCYLAYLVYLGFLVCAIAGTTLLLAFLSWATIRDRFVLAYQGQGVRGTRLEQIIVIVTAFLAVAASITLPMWIPPLLAGVAFLVVSGSLLFAGDGLILLWRPQRDAAVHSLDGRWYVWFYWTVIVLVSVNLMMLTCGELIWGTQTGGSTTSPLIMQSGRLFSWLALPGLGAAVYHCLRFASLGLRFNPQRERLLEPSPDESSPTSSHRRWEINHRRALVRGLKKLFKRASRVSRRSGTGLWIGLQHWFVLGLSRDTAEDDREKSVIEDIIGPPYHRVFPRPARYHFWQITRSLDVDLILVEDGVTFQRFVRVLRMMFEIYDIFGGRQRAEELHFTGLPGVRVIIHEFGMGTSEWHNASGYPQPDYREIGRARILHVFKDRGEQEEFDPVPTGSEGAPVFSGV